ncbi:MAG: helix-hairpin-helix domain-containing protein [Lachnospiraceae bacterium]|nr:helix-hairpin-helix domain-containing protein [Lachnospiraceae bacterium]
MTYKRIRDLAVFGLALLLSMSLSGCSFSFLGFRVGKSEEFVFYCAEDSQTSAAVQGNVESSARAEMGSESSADALTVESAETGGGLDEAGTATEGSAEGTGGVTAAQADVDGSSAGSAEGVSQDVSGGDSDDTRVNINTADREALMSLNGIGESRADAIIEYRTQNGSFMSTEQIMEVSGIAEGIYAKIKDQIRVQ